MSEKVVVNQGIPKYLPKFKNPLYQAALERKKELREEILCRIKTGDLPNGLYPLVKNITLTKEELDEIFACWRMDNRQMLLFLYGLILRTMDLEQVKLADTYLLNMKKKEENLGKDR